MESTCAVMIATRNRREDLRRTCTQIAALLPAPDEVLICADGCSDGTVEMLAAEFPAFRIFENEQPLGSTASRDRLMRLATSELVLSLDDDSYPLETEALRRLGNLFAKHPRLAVASFPQRTDEFPETLTASSFAASHRTGTYVNCACAFRRSVFLDLGGHDLRFWNAYDEPDYALRCLAAGWQVRFEPTITVRHHYSGVNRNEMRMHHLHARNECWSVLMRCPMPQLIGVLAFRLFRQMHYAWKRGRSWVWREPQWWFAALRGASESLAHRHPVRWEDYLAWMRLVRKPVPDQAVSPTGKPEPAR